MSSHQTTIIFALSLVAAICSACSEPPESTNNGSEDVGVESDADVGADGDVGSDTTLPPEDLTHRLAQVTGGRNMSCGLDDEGVAHCWGQDTWGSLGGADSHSSTPAPAGEGYEFSRISTGNLHTCGVDTSGNIVCWGNNNWGQVRRESPTAGGWGPRVVWSDREYVEVASGATHSCAIAADGTVTCWGGNEYGELGGSTGTERWGEITLDEDIDFEELTLGTQFSCGLSSDGTAYCWGLGERGALGNRSTQNSLEPVEVAGGHTFVSLTAGAQHVCGITDSKSTLCWGWNGSGQLGHEASLGEARDSPAAVSGDHEFVQVESAYAHTCGLTAGGHAYCWGTNANGVLGRDSERQSVEPVPVDTTHRFAWLSAGDTHTCGGAWDGEIYCWGSNYYGELADGRTLNAFAPRRVETDETFVDVVAADYTTCALDEQGRLFCWGDGRTGELADGAFRSRSRVTRSASDYTFDDVGLGQAHGCGLESGGTIVCWGQNVYGAFGITTEQPYLSEPVLVDSGNSWSGVANGFYHHCAINESGVVSCAGRNDYGQAGIGAATEATELRAVDHRGTFAILEATRFQTCAIDDQGGAWCWGDNEGGALGDGTYQNRTSPVAVDSEVEFRSLALGHYHTCGVADDGRGYCWGPNFYGRLGVGESVQDATSPMAVSGGHRFTQMAAGSDFTCGITDEGPTYCWGGDFDGELGLGEGAFLANDYSATPQIIAGDHAFTRLAAGTDHVCGLNDAGEVYCWGGGFFGQLGDGARVQSVTPIEMVAP